MSLPIFRDIVLREETREHRRAGTDYLSEEKEKEKIRATRQRNAGFGIHERSKRKRRRDGDRGDREKKNKRRVGRILRQPFRFGLDWIGVLVSVGNVLDTRIEIRQGSDQLRAPRTR